MTPTLAMCNHLVLVYGNDSRVHTPDLRSQPLALVVLSLLRKFRVLLTNLVTAGGGARAVLDGGAADCDGAESVRTVRVLLR